MDGQLNVEDGMSCDRKAYIMQRHNWLAVVRRRWDNALYISRRPETRVIERIRAEKERMPEEERFSFLEHGSTTITFDARIESWECHRRTCSVQLCLTFFFQCHRLVSIKSITLSIHLYTQSDLELTLQKMYFGNLPVSRGNGAFFYLQKWNLIQYAFTWPIHYTKKL